MSAAPKSPPTGRWYYVVTLCSAGLLAWLPFVHAGRHLDRPAVTKLAWRYAAAALVIGILIAVSPRNARGAIDSNNAFATIGSLVALAVIAIGCVQQAPLRREVYGGAPSPTTLDPAMAQALEARERRAKARQVAVTDPLLARDLRIGRPDLLHDYDDGGLVDLNSAPATVIAEVCGLDQPTAEGIEAARPPGGFMAVDDVFSFTDIPVAAWDAIRDRAVVIPRLH